MRVKILSIPPSILFIYCLIYMNIFSSGYAIASECLLAPKIALAKNSIQDLFFQGLPYTTLSKDEFITKKRAEEFSKWLINGWESKASNRDIVSYDPESKMELALEKMQVLFLSQRITRPGGQTKKPLPLINDPHVLNGCLFCDKKFVKRHSIGKILINGREYAIILNKYPISSAHFLLIKSDKDQVSLNQNIHNEEEMLDLLTLRRYLTKEFMLIFNFLPGKGKSDGAATINHWHAQIFPQKAGFYSNSIQPITQFGSSSIVALGQINMPTGNRIFEGTDISKVAKKSFSYLDFLSAQLTSNNLAFLIDKENHPAVVMTPRKKGVPNTELIGTRTQQRLGPSEINGVYIESNPDHFKLMQEKSKDAEKAILQRLKEIGFTRNELLIFDTKYQIQCAI